ncbi:MAG: hypothetical protein AAF108_07195 [Planctomycetota bacterium]
MSVVWLIVIIGGAAIFAWQAWPLVSVADWAGLTAILLLLYRQLSKMSPWLDLTTRKLVLWVANTATQWSLDVRITSDAECDPEEVLDNLASTLEGRSDFGPVKLSRESPTKLVARFHRAFVAEVTAGLLSHGSEVTISVLDTHMGYRDSLTRLRKHLIPFVETVEKHAPSSSGTVSKYAVVVYLGDHNPFYRSVTRDLPTAKIDQFAINAKLDDADSRLTISGDQISVVSGSLTRMQEQLARVFGIGAAVGD